MKIKHQIIIIKIFDYLKLQTSVDFLLKLQFILETNSMEYFF
jgi:hypothetical protein